MPGELPSERYPIGLVPVIQHAQRAQIADFYAKYYRPERATLVAVGDFDLDAMEAKIKSRFGDWQGQRPPGGPRACDLGQVPARRGLQVPPGRRAGRAHLRPDRLGHRRRTCRPDTVRQAPARHGR